MSVTLGALAADAAPAVAGSDRRPLPVLTVQSVTEAEWEGSIGEFDGVCQEQLTTFARERWPAAAREPLHFFDAGRVVGGCLVLIQSLPLRLGAVAVAKWGPVLADAAAPGAMELYAGMIEALVERYARQRRLLLSVLPHVSLSGTNPEYEHLLARGFHAGAKLAFPDRYLVNLRLDDAAQRRSLEQKWRYHLNKAEKAGLAFEHADASRLPEFDALYRAMTGRKKFTDYSAYDTVPALMSIADPRLRPELFFVRHEGSPVAGAIIFKAGDRAVYLYGATDDRALALRAGYFMHWHIIRWLRDHTRASWYDLGGTDGFHGLHQFKKGMVGSAGLIRPLPPAANYAAYPLPFLLGEAAFAAREAVHLAQRLLDRVRPGAAKPDQKQGTRGQ